MILNKTIKINVIPRFVKYYNDLGYVCRSRDVIEIDIKHLSKSSKLKVDVECDRCGRTKNITYFSYTRNIEKYKFYACCSSCAKEKNIQTNQERYEQDYFNNIEKRKQTNMDLYGVEYSIQRIDVLEKRKQTNLELYGEVCPLLNEDVKKKTIQTNIDKYETDHAMKNKDVQLKTRQTNIELYGEVTPLLNKDVIEKCKVTKKDLYGDVNYNNREKYKKTCLKLFGFDNPMKNEQIKKKLCNTMMDMYGVEYAAQHEVFFTKMVENGITIKKYEDSTLYYQGTYEKDFLDRYIDQYDIERGSTIKYNFENKEHTYYPDFYIGELNLIIEIKSDYWFNLHKEQNLQKEKSCKNAGYNFLFIINKDYCEFNNLIKFDTYKKSHCWQYQIRLDNVESDINFIKNENIDISELKVSDFEFEYIEKDNKEKCIQIKKFIEKYEWLGNMPNRPTNRFIAKYKGVLAGVVVMATPNSQSKYLGEDTKNLEKLISRGACASWTPKNLASSLIMWSIRWMVKNTQFRLFTAYSDPEAKELGTIYQACNFKYLGKQKINKMYFDHNKPHLGWTTGRNFRKKSYYKKYAKELNIIWDDKWERNYSILWENMPVSVKNKLKVHSKQYQLNCSVRTPKAKHKYCYILGSNNSETKYYNNIFNNNNPDKNNLKYPKER